MSTWHLAPRANPDYLGAIPFIITSDDPRPVREQIAGRYAHGGGYMPLSRWTLDLDRAEPLKSSARYPGDPIYAPLAWAQIRAELVILFPYSWVCIVQPDGSFAMTRMD